MSHKISTPRGFNFNNSNGSFKFEYDSNFGSKWSNAFNVAQRYVDSEVLRLCEPLAPRDSGAFIESGRMFTVIGSGLIMYFTVYGKRIYYSYLNFQGAPQRGAYFFERVKVQHKRSILAGANRIAGGR